MQANQRIMEDANVQNELFGNVRLLAALNEEPDSDPETLLRTIRKHIDRFVGDAPQFDDITMLNILYKGSEEKSIG